MKRDDNNSSQSIFFVEENLITYFKTNRLLIGITREVPFIHNRRSLRTALPYI